MNSIRCFIYTALILFANPVVPLNLYAEGLEGLSKGQTIYVPAYAHIYSGVREKPFYLTVTLSIRNIDPRHPITIVSVDYYESQGVHLKKIVDKPVALQALGAIRRVVSQKDKSGGSGANFIVRWTAENAVNAPIVETIMIGTQSGQGISFTSRGKALLLPE